MNLQFHHGEIKTTTTIFDSFLKVCHPKAMIPKWSKRNNGQNDAD